MLRVAPALMRLLGLERNAQISPWLGSNYGKIYRLFKQPAIRGS
jgi:hypothetical protein